MSEEQRLQINLERVSYLHSVMQVYVAEFHRRFPDAGCRWDLPETLRVLEQYRNILSKLTVQSLIEDPQLLVMMEKMSLHLSTAILTIEQDLGRRGIDADEWLLSCHANIFKLELAKGADTSWLLDMRDAAAARLNVGLNYGRRQFEVYFSIPPPSLSC